jgi:hypothetical protein
MSRPTQRHQLFAAAAAGNLSPIPSDNENGEFAANSSNVSDAYDFDHDDLPEDADITAEQPPAWDSDLDDDEDDDDHLARHRYGGSQDSLDSFEEPLERNGAGDGEDSLVTSPIRSYASPSSIPRIMTPTSPTTPTTPTTPKGVDKLQEKAPERRGARIVVPKTEAKPSKPRTTNGSSAKAPLYRTKPAKSSRPMPKLEHIQSSIPKPIPKSALKQSDSVEKKKGEKSIRENKASINRKKNLIIQQSRDLEAEEKEMDYLTPLQKKNNYIKELETALKDTKTKLALAEEKVANVDVIIHEKIKDVVARKDQEIEKLKGQIKELEIANEDLNCSYQESLRTIKALEDTVEEMKVRKNTSLVFIHDGFTSL